MDENYTRKTTFNPFDLPEDRMELKGKLFLLGIEKRLDESISYIKEKYINSEILNQAIEFVHTDMSDAVKSTMDQLRTIGFYPIVEAELELDYAMKHALFGSYKAAFSDLRRALELTVLSVYFTSNEVHRKKAHEWMNSSSDTPFMGTMLKELIKCERFSNLNRQFKWKDNLNKLYWAISDFAHNKGRDKSYNTLNRVTFGMGGSHLTNINTETLGVFLDHYLETVREMVTILALYNPVILVGLPIDEKFGFEGPFSGFYGEYQSNLLSLLLPDKYNSYFEDLKRTDDEIKSVENWIHSMPDITEEEIKIQILEHKKMLSSKDNNGESNESTIV